MLSAVDTAVLSHTHFDHSGGTRRFRAEQKSEVVSAWGLLPDDFSHEQRLVFETPYEFVVLNSCCTASAHNNVSEALSVLPCHEVAAIFGGSILKF